MKDIVNRIENNGFLKRNIRLMRIEAIVIGMSWGGMQAMKVLFSRLPDGFKIPIIIVQHLSSLSDSKWIRSLNKDSSLTIKEADEKEAILPGHVYIAPPNYHLLIEKNKTFTLTIDEKVNFARPAIDVLFESASDVFKKRLIGIILTGSNHDGTKGIKKIKENGGLTLVEDPETATSSLMPLSAIKMNPDHILPLEKIIELIIELDKQNQ
jgi:two-component system chemotaxis response regulator CheB